MPRDYAKRSSHHSSNGGSSFGSTLLWFFIGVLAGLALAGFIYVSKNNKSPQAKRPEIVLPANPKNNPPPAAAANNNKAQFDFYNMLPSKQVTGPTGQQEATQASATSPAPLNTTPPPPAAATPPANVNPNAMLAQPPAIAATPAPAVVTPTATKTKPTAAAPAPSAQRYELQIGAFTNFAQADNLKAQLILSGFNAHSDTLKKGTSTLHRIWLGPYKTKDEAKTVQAKLKAAAIKSTLIKK